MAPNASTGPPSGPSAVRRSPPDPDVRLGDRWSVRPGGGTCIEGSPWVRAIRRRSRFGRRSPSSRCSSPRSAIPASASATEFPAGKTGYHSYTEVAADIAAMAAAHPDIVQRFSIGKSYQGREIWAAKVSDNVTVDEPEPEVLFDGGTHSDEHMGVEMTLHILHWLVDGYGTDTRITNIVNTREIWIVFVVNPDGAEYDISGGKFHFWRKNRQPTPGTELHRDRPEPELRLPLGRRRPDELEPAGDHLPRAERVLGARDAEHARLPGQPGRRRPAADPHGHHLPRERPARDVAVRLHLHEHPDRHDRRRPRGARRRSASSMAATNGYKPEQASDLYISSGTTRDYEYGTYRIFSYTFEMSVETTPTTRSSPRRPGATRRRSCTSWSGPGARSRSSGPRPARPAAAPSTTTSRSRAAGRSTPTAPTPRPRRHGSRAATRH